MYTYKYSAEVRKEGSIGAFGLTRGTVESNSTIDDDIGLSAVQIRIIDQHRTAGYETLYINRIETVDSADE